MLFVVMASDAEALGVGLGEHNLAVLCRCMAKFAGLLREGRMHELGHQLGRIRLMRIVALNTIGLGEGLILVRILQVGVLGVVTVETKRRSRLGEMEAVFSRRLRSGFVGSVADIASHIERGMATALLRNVQTGLMATEAEVLFFAA
jgi:hypothetical protein